MKSWLVLPTWLRPLKSAVIAVMFSLAAWIILHYRVGWSYGWGWIAWWTFTGFVGGCIGDYICFRWKSRRRVDRSAQRPTIRHIPADGSIPPGFIRVPDLFEHEGKREDGLVQPGAPICIDILRPGESVSFGIGITAQPTPLTTPEKVEPNKKENL